MKQSKCIICHDELRGFGNNPEPLHPINFRCCDYCNDTKVMPSRMHQTHTNK
jgi:hypothetical protein